MSTFGFIVAHNSFAQKAPNHSSGHCPNQELKRRATAPMHQALLAIGLLSKQRWRLFLSDSLIRFLSSPAVYIDKAALRPRSFRKEVCLFSQEIEPCMGDSRSTNISHNKYQQIGCVHSIGEKQKPCFGWSWGWILLGYRGGHI